ncbi:MAG TPA: hypothetical protein VH724_15375, partial [Candidatus Angelobacter sp.]|nr:hypothetical protein [Candidatus Angelobacter sp.]
IKSRPACVQALAKEFPLNTSFQIEDGDKWYLVGYTEDDKLIVSRFDPFKEYTRAMEDRSYICASHIRKHFYKDQH